MNKTSITFDFCPEKNGGETLLFCSFFDNEYIMHQLILCSYGNTASFSLEGEMITPAKLRDLANKLEAFLKENDKE